MSQETRKNKGGRPRKVIKRSEQLAVMCTPIERAVIEHKSRLFNLSISSFLRGLGVDGKVNFRTLPKEVLALMGQLNHIRACLNQIAKKRNVFDTLNAIERAELNVLSNNLKDITSLIRNYLK